MSGLIPSLAVLGLALVIALRMTVTRRSPASRERERALAAMALAIALVAQAVHFAEEASTGFREALGAVLGLEAMPVGFFIAFNMTWLAIWAASVGGVRRGRGWAFLAAWFLATAGMMNGALHPLLAMVSASYFPGLWSSPMVGAVSVWLWIRLRQATESAHAPHPMPS